MTRLAWLAVAAILAATGCGRTGGDSAPTAAPAPGVAIRAIDLAPTSTGALLAVRAVAPVQGYWNPTLVPQATDLPGRLSFAFAAEPPVGSTRVLTERSREIAVATVLSPDDLAGIREIEVHGAGDAHELRF